MLSRHKHYGWLFASISIIGGSIAGVIPFGRYLIRMVPDDDYILDKVLLVFGAVIVFGSVCAFAAWMTWPTDRREMSKS